MTFGGSPKRVLVLVLAMDAQPWRMIEDEGQRATWAAQPDGGIPVFWLYGKTGILGTLARYAQRAVLRFTSASVFRWYSRVVGAWVASLGVREVGDRIETTVPETYLNTNPKTVAGFRHLLATQDFDFVFRTNSSSYVNLPMLQEFVQSIPTERFYGGFIGESGGVRFASGACTLMSRDLVQHVVTDPEWEFGIIDDVAMGRSMMRAGVAVQPVKRIDVLSLADIDALKAEDLRSVFVVRCKNSDARAHDVSAMRRVHELYTELLMTPDPQVP